MQDMPSMEAVPNDADQAEWERQMDIMVKSHLSFPSILSFVIYNGAPLFSCFYSPLTRKTLYQRAGVSKTRVQKSTSLLVSSQSSLVTN